MFPPLLQVERLRVEYGGITAVADYSLTVRAGEVVTVVGPLGAGKTSLLRAVAGLSRSAAGAMWLDGARIDRMRTDRLSRRGAVLVPAAGSIFPTLTVAENLALSLPRRQGLSNPARAVALEWFPILEERLRQTAGTLSGGEQRQLSLARAIVSSPRLLLLDEPLLGLSPALSRQVGELVRGIAAGGCGVLLAEERPSAALHPVVHRWEGIRSGRNAAAGAGAEVVRAAPGATRRPALDSVEPEPVAIPMTLRQKRALQTMASLRGQRVGEILSRVVRDVVDTSGETSP